MRLSAWGGPKACRSDENRKEFSDMLIDEQAYADFLSGNTAAFDALMLRYGDSLTLYLHAILHDWHDAEDLMIEAFARIMVKRPAIRTGGFQAYLFKTGRNLALRFAAKRGKTSAFSPEALQEELAETVFTESAYLKAERGRALYRCLGRIEPQYREALWLVYLQELSYRQAAQVLGVREKRIDHLLQRGKTLLRQELEKEGVTDAHE